MKRIALIIFLIQSLNLTSQMDSVFSKLYFRSAFSINVGTNQSQYLFDPLNSVEFNQNNYTNPVFGNGFSLVGGLGFRFTKHIAVESNFSYMKGNETSLYSYETSTKFINATMTDNQQILFNPMFVLSTDFKKIHPYIKVGLVIPLSNQSTFNYSIQSISDDRFLNKYNYQIENELNLGLNGCVGVSYSVSNNFELFIEAEEANTRSFHSKTTGLKSEEISLWLPPNSIQSFYNFVDSKDVNSTTKNDILNFPISFGRQSYNFGIKYNF